MSANNGKRHAYGDAFLLMWFQCDICGAREQIWNSRDGITPFYVDCRSCSSGSTARHVAWKTDVYAPNHTPKVGDRIFVNLTLEKALTNRRRYVESMQRQAPSRIKKDFLEQFGTLEAGIEALAKQDIASFASVTPDLVVVEKESK